MSLIKKLKKDGSTLSQFNGVTPPKYSDNLPE